MTTIELGHGHDAAQVAAGLVSQDSIRWRPIVRVDKFDDDQVAWVARKSGVVVPQGDLLRSLVKPYETVERAGNLLTTAGLDRITKLLLNTGSPTALGNTTCRLGVGDSSTAAAIGQTDLQASSGSTHRWFQVMDATFPTQANGLMTFKATFATGDGNFAWAEWCVDIGTATVTSGNTVNACMLNRAVQSLGTKVSGSWALTATITLS